MMVGSDVLDSIAEELRQEGETTSPESSTHHEPAIDVREAEEQIREQSRSIKYLVNQYTVLDLVERYENSVEQQREDEEGGEFFVPHYQRLFVWPVEHQSKYIETLLLGLPVSALLLAQEKKPITEDFGRVEIVDGSQRIRTLQRFIRNHLILTGLERLTKLNGARFKDLHPSRQKKLERVNVRVYELPDDVSEEDRMDVFFRTNTTSLTLADAEVRRGAFQGPFYNSIRRLSKTELVREMIPVGELKGARQEVDELLLRFFAYTEDYKEFNKRVDDFLDSFVRRHQGEFPPQWESLLVSVLNFAKNYYPNGFRKSPSHKTVPRVRFEAIAVGTALALKEKPNLTPIRPIEWINSPELTALTTSDGSNSAPRLKRRIEFVRDMLLETAE